MRMHYSSGEASEEALDTRSFDSDLTTLASFIELTKPRVTVMVLVTVAAGFYLASDSLFSLSLLFQTLLGTALVAGGTAALNQFMERKADGRMRRTHQRPLPSARVRPGDALLMGMAFIAVGTFYLLWFVNFLTALLGWITCVVYLLAYTPLKTRTEHCTLIGAFPGAIPPLMGWAAVRGSLGMDAWVLFLVLFAWQFPHFFAIGWLYRDDYRRGGFQMIPVADPDGRRTGLNILAYSILLLLVSLLPVITGLAGFIYAGAALVLGLGILWYAAQVVVNPSKSSAGRLLKASVIYLPLVLIFMVLDKV